MFTAPGAPLRLFKLLTALAAFAALALPAVATAATISYDGSGALVYQAGPGEKNYFGYYDEGGRVAISDSGPSSINYPVDRCDPGWISYVVVCDVPTAIHASFGDGDDIADGNDEVDVPVAFDA